jgi:hypothetical protein
MHNGVLPLPVVDGLDLPESVRSILRPDEHVTDATGIGRRLPRFFYMIDSWQTALELDVSPHFKLWEFIGVDVREATVQRQFPRYIPCAVTLLAAHLELVRDKLGSYVHIAANGGYRSPSHELSTPSSTHCWATAANIYRVGDEWYNSRESIERGISQIRAIMPSLWLRPYGHGKGEADDHIHVDIGYAVLEPRGTVGRDPEEARRVERESVVA